MAAPWLVSRSQQQSTGQILTRCNTPNTTESQSLKINKFINTNKGRFCFSLFFFFYVNKKTIVKVNDLLLLTLNLLWSFPFDFAFFICCFLHHPVKAKGIVRLWEKLPN